VGILENRYDVFDGQFSCEEHGRLHILVLGGGHSSDPRMPATNQLSQEALGRLVEGVRLHQKHPGSILILSGYAGRDPVSNAEVMFRAALILGVNARQMHILPEPRNTRQEAIAYHNRFGIHHPLILVTSASHMPRAMIWFRKAGLTPVPAPTNHMIKKGPSAKIRWWVPATRFIELTDRAVYEYAGIVQALLARNM